MMPSQKCSKSGNHGGLHMRVLVGWLRCSVIRLSDGKQFRRIDEFTACSPVFDCLLICFTEIEFKVDFNFNLCMTIYFRKLQIQYRY
jgi:hypothetical protein